MIAIAIIQIGFVYLGGSLLRTVPLLPDELRIALVAALLVFPADLVRKLIWRWLIRKPKY